MLIWGGGFILRFVYHFCLFPKIKPYSDMMENSDVLMDLNIT